MSPHRRTIDTSRRPAEGRVATNSSDPSKLGKSGQRQQRHPLPDLVQLWFQDSNGNLRMAVFNVETNQLLHTTQIRRQ